MGKINTNFFLGLKEKKKKNENNFEINSHINDKYSSNYSLKGNNTKSKFKSNFGYYSGYEHSSINKRKIKKNEKKNLNKLNLKNDIFGNRCNSIGFGNNNALYKGLDNLVNNNSIIPSMNMKSEINAENHDKYKGILNEMEIMKINEKIHDDINLLQLKKKF